MQQLSITYFYPLTEQIELDLDYTPCLKYEEDKLKNSLYVGNRVDQWGVVDGTTLISSSYATLTDPRLIIYPESIPITIKTTKKPSFFARWVYGIIGAKWEQA